MWGGILFIAIAIACLVLAAYLTGTIRGPRLRRRDKPQDPPIVGWAGSDPWHPKL